ncbi:YgfZ/GcvT domain-containing protein [Necropsobacter rosorum]|uniref:CAF17-like 4Fe-4S cluster assembly/insertion protein YgfZ n=1 Tax=Necropsobacter rosorum TaxID=908285 RepID=UPI00068C7E60
MRINLAQYGVISAQGAEAEKFLQGQLTCDVTQLADGQSTLAAHCDPKGKINSLFRLIRHDRQQFYLLVRQNLLADTLAQLKKYAVFSDISFTLPDWPIIGIAGENAPQTAAHLTLTLPTQPTRYILLNPAEPDCQCDTPAAYWDIQDIRAGIPLLSPQSRLEFIPQALNLPQLEQAVSFTKGCYIGQETIARAKYRGINKRAMFTFRAATAVTPDIGAEIEMRLESGWRKTGFILSAVNFDGVLWLQVVLNNQLPAEAEFRLPHSETGLEAYPLPYAPQ